MTKWKLQTAIKKCVHEQQVYTNDQSEDVILAEWWWRWGTVYFTTPDDVQPDIDLSETASIDIMSLPYDELDHTLDDGWVYNTEFPESMSQEDIERFEEDMFGWLEENGWEHTHSDITFEGPLELEKA